MKQQIDYAFRYSIMWTRTFLQLVGMISCFLYVRPYIPDYSKTVIEAPMGITAPRSMYEVPVIKKHK